MRNDVENAKVEIKRLTEEIETLESRIASKRHTLKMLDAFVNQNCESVGCRLCGKVVPCYGAVRVVVRVDQPVTKIRTFTVCDDCIGKLVE